jgi:hypothetical protein
MVAKALAPDGVVPVIVCVGFDAFIRQQYLNPISVTAARSLFRR